MRPAATHGGAASGGAASEVDAYAHAVARLRVAVVRLARQLRQSSPGGLTSSQWSALVTVEESGRLRIGDLAEREGVSAPTATRLVAGLEEAGLLDRTGDPADRRTSYVTLSETGQAKLADARGATTASLYRRVSQLPRDEAERILAVVPVLESLVADTSSKT